MDNKTETQITTRIREDLHRVVWMLARETEPLTADQIAAARRWTRKHTQDVLAAGLLPGELLQLLPDGRYTVRPPQAC